MNLGQAIYVDENNRLTYHPTAASALALEVWRIPIHAYAALKPPAAAQAPHHRKPLGPTTHEVKGGLAQRMLQGLRGAGKISFLELTRRIDCSNSKPNRQVLWQLVSYGRVRAQGAREKRVYWIEAEE